jgi:hypothetical protein
MGGQRELGEHIAGKPHPKANRQQDNIGCLKSLRMDVDAKQYKDIPEMDEAIAKFYTETDIPPAPFAVKSGSGGYHLYWVFDRLVTPEEWQPLADALAAAALSTGLKLDTECTVDRTRILRVPGTKNYKDPLSPRNVEIYYDTGEDLTYEQLSKTFAKWLTAPVNRGYDDDEDVRNMQSGGKSYAPADIDLVAEECGFVDHTLVTGGADYSEKLWHLTIALACHTTNPSDTAHRLSSKYHAYQFEETEEKLAEAQRTRQRNSSMGPPLCKTIIQYAPQCATCKHRNKGTTPISFGYGRNGHAYHGNPANDLPRGYERKPDGKIIWQQQDPNTHIMETHNVLSIPIIPNSARLESGSPYIFVFDTPEGKVSKVIRLPGGALTDLSTLGKLLGDQGCVTVPNKYTREFMTSFIEQLKAGSGLITLAPMGWDGAGFSFNGTHYSTTGEQRSKTLDARLKYGVQGDDKAWRTLADIIVSRKRPDLCCLVATGFAAPLTLFTGHNGFLVGAISSQTGVGKTSALSLAQSIFGSPSVMNGLSDTVNHITDKVATLKNVLLVHDEIKDPEQAVNFVKMVTVLTQGREKGRSDRTGAMRPVREWETMIGYAANSSMVDFASNYSKGTAAIIVRMLEIKAEGEKDHKEADVARLVGTLKQNYGHIGVKYARYLGENKSIVDKFVAQQQDWFENKIGYHEGERFWFAAAATLTAGSYLALKLGFAPFEPLYLRDYLCERIKEMRGKRKDFMTDYANVGSVVNDLSNFLKEHQAHGTLVTNTILTHRGQPAKNKIVIRNGTPYQRWDNLQVHIGLNPLVLRFSSTALGTWCKSQNIPKESLVSALIANFGAVCSTAMLGSGTKMSQMSEKCFTIELTGTALEKEVEWVEQFK